MGMIPRIRLREKRALVILCALMSYVLLLFLNAQYVFPPTGAASAIFLPWVRFGFSALVALLFLSVGALVWLSARNRLVARLLFCFCAAMMLSFSVQTAAKADVPLFSVIGEISSISALFTFAVLLLVFPRNYLSSYTVRGTTNKATRMMLGSYMVVLLVLGLVASLFFVLRSFVLLQFVQSDQFSLWLRLTYSSYYVIALSGILLTVVVSYLSAKMLRERQQIRLFVGGVIVAFTPCFVLTILPVSLNLPAEFIVDSQFSTLTVILLPLVLGYSILRYQILVVDASIRRVVGWVVGGVGLALLVYLVVILCSLSLHTVPSASAIIWPALIMAPAGPFVWHRTQVLTQRLFFPEIWHYRRLLEQPTLLARAPLNLEETARLLSVALTQALEPTAVCLFVLEKETGRYKLTPVLSTADSGDELRRGLAQQVCKAVRSGSGEQVDWLDARGDMIARLTAASRPLFLSEACRGDAEGPMGLMRYMAASTTAAGDDPLLAPIWAKGEMIGVLVLGKRGDHQAYAGPDFEAISLILARYASDLDNARLALDLRIAYERQKELDRLKDQFIVTASHELRTPLTAVQGYIELLADLDQELAPQMRAEFLRTVRRSCDELTLMVGNIMDAGRVEIDARQVRVGPVPLAQPVLRCGEILDGLIRGEKRTLHVDVSPALYVMADDFRLCQVLLNLIGNALKYSPPGTNVEVTCDQCDEQVTVRVRDYGSGVPPEDQARLFHRFVRLERDMNSPMRGAGLGLYISKQLIEAMGGHIWVESTGVPGEGSTFSFTLNAVPVNAERKGTNQVGVEGR